MFSGNTTASGGTNVGLSGIISGILRTNSNSSAHFITLNSFGLTSGPKINGSDYILVTGQADTNTPYGEGVLYKNVSEFFFLCKGYWGAGFAINLNTGAWTASPSLPEGQYFWRSGPTRLDSCSWSSSIYYVDNPTWATISSLSWTDTGVGEGYQNGYGTLSNGTTIVVQGSYTFEYPPGTWYYGYTKSKYKTIPTGGYSTQSFNGTTGSTTGSGIVGDNGTKFYHWNTDGSLRTSTSGTMTYVGSASGYTNPSYNQKAYIPSWDKKNSRFIQHSGGALKASTNGLTWSTIANYTGVGTSLAVTPLEDGTYLWFGTESSTLYIYYCSSNFTVLDTKTLNIGGTTGQSEIAIGQPALKDYNAYNLVL